MEKQDKPDKQAPPRKPSPVDEAMQVISEYADGLRAIIEKLRRKLN